MFDNVFFITNQNVDNDFLIRKIIECMQVYLSIATTVINFDFNAPIAFLNSMV